MEGHQGRIPLDETIDPKRKGYDGKTMESAGETTRKSAPECRPRPRLHRRHRRKRRDRRPSPRRSGRRSPGLGQYPRERKRLLLEYPPLYRKMDRFPFHKYKRQFYPIPVQIDAAFQLDVLFEIELAAAMPFEDRFFGIPYQRQELLEHPP